MFNFTLLNRWGRFLGVKTIFWSYTTQRKQSNKFSSSMSQLLARWSSKLSRLTHRVVPLKFLTLSAHLLISSEWSPQLWSSPFGRDHSPLLHLSLTMRCFSTYKNVVFYIFNQMMLSNSQVFHLKNDTYFHPDSGWNTSVVGFSLTLQRFSFKYVCLYFLPTGDGTG